MESPCEILVLLRVATDDALFASYFWWRTFYKVVNEDAALQAQYWCFYHTMLFLKYLHSGADYVICCGHERTNVARVLCQILMIGGLRPYLQ